MSQPLRLVVFDIDGTLVDSQNHITAAMALAFAGLERPAPSRAEVRAIVGLSLTEAMARLLPDAAPGLVTQAVEGYKRAYASMRAAQGEDGNAPLFEDARAVIERLAARPDILIGAATGMARRGLDHVFAAHDLDSFFVTRQTADLHPSKPHPAMLLAALGEAGVEPGNAVMIGDTTFDIDMAVAAGVPAIGVSWGYHGTQALQRAGAAAIVDDFAALPAALDELWRSSQ